MTWCRGLESIVERDADLSRLTWFRVGGSARWLVRPRSESELGEVLVRLHQDGVAGRVLGLGANLLVSDAGVPDAVIRLDHPSFRSVRCDGTRMIAGGGTDMGRLALQAARHGLAGIECMAGIPGTIGGCVRMNAGGKFGEIAETVRRVRVLNERGEPRDLCRDEIPFRYRHSGLEGTIIAEVELELTECDPDALLPRYDEIWAYKRASQPLAAKSAGCIFKNPENDFAGALIERAGCKGTRKGTAWVSQHHANFIVADSDGTATDVLAVIDEVRRRVFESSGIRLELEVEVWPTTPRWEPRPAAVVLTA